MRLEAPLRATWHAARRVAPRWSGAVAASRLPRATVPALLTTHPTRFAAHELRGGGRLAEHRLREGGWAFAVHHGSWDAAVVAEVFRARHYALPAAAEARLRATPEPLRVVDLGAHVGLFTVWALQCFPGARVAAYEPDPENFAALRRTLAANGARAAGVDAVQACAAAADGEVEFAAGGSSSARRAAGGGIRVAARDVLPLLAGADLVKIDIEGGEWELLDDPRFAGVTAPVVLLEYHAHLCPGGDPRARARDRLDGLGYRVADVFAEERVGLLRAIREPA